MSLITISESIGCEGMIVARLVADGLKLELYDDRKLEEAAVRIGIQPDVPKDLGEKAPGLFSRIFNFKPQYYRDLLQAVVYEVVKRGQGIIMGHGSQALLRDFRCALHVRIVASESYRIDHLMNQRGLTHEAAMKLIYKTDNERRGFLQFAFHMDWNDQSLYDLVINRDKMSTDLAAKVIVEAARSQEIMECSQMALDSMERLSLAGRVEAAVLEHNLSLDVSHRDILHIEVPEKGVVHITGVAQDPEQRLLKVVKDVPGVTEVRSEVSVPGFVDDE